MRSKTSPLFSLMDPFDYRAERVNAFEDLGDAPRGERHLVVFFRNVTRSKMTIEYASPVQANKHCTVYNILNEQGVLYGLLFVVNRDKYTIRNTCLIVRGTSESAGNFAIVPLTSEKLRIFMYRDSADTLIVNLGDTGLSPFVVLDE